MTVDPGTISAEMLVVHEQAASELGPLPDATLLPPAEGRALADRVNRRWNVDLPALARKDAAVVEADADLGSADCPLLILTPSGASGGTILYVHGGGFAFGSPQSHERCASVLAIEAGMSVVMPDYRLAPEHPFPLGLTDVVACLRAVLAGAMATLDTRPLIVAGDSAGANLALAAMLHEHEAGRPLPDGSLLFYGNYSADLSGDSYRRFADGPGLTTARMARYWAWYAGERDIARDALACPLAASDQALAAMPPLYLMAAGVDPLFSDSVRLQARLAALGRPETLDIVPGVTHGFLQATRELAAAREALARAGQAARTIKTKTETASREEAHHETVEYARR
jgi:acetyl esterase